MLSQALFGVHRTGNQSLWLHLWAPSSPATAPLQTPRPAPEAPSPPGGLPACCLPAPALGPVLPGHVATSREEFFPLLGFGFSLAVSSFIPGRRPWPADSTLPPVSLLRRVQGQEFCPKSGLPPGAHAVSTPARAPLSGAPGAVTAYDPPRIFPHGACGQPGHLFGCHDGSFVQEPPREKERLPLSWAEGRGEARPRPSVQLPPPPPPPPASPAAAGASQRGGPTRGGLRGDNVSHGQSFYILPVLYLF